MYGNLFFKISLPNQRSPFPKLLKSELLAAALRYRPPTSQKAIPTERFAIALPYPKKRSFSNVVNLNTLFQKVVFDNGGKYQNHYLM